MIRSLLMTCADGVVRDAQTNNVSIFNILEQFASPGFPLFVPRVFVFNLLERDAEDPAQIDCHVVVRNNDVELLRTPIRVDFVDKMRNRTIVVLAGLAIPNPGILRVSLYYNDIELAHYTMNVVSTQPPHAAPNQV